MNKTFFCKLIPPRSSFAQDLSPAEAKLMQDHAVYWKELMAKGYVVTFGLVGDPAGAYGIGILECEDDDAVRSLTDNDPTIKARQGFRYEIQPMPRGAVHP